MTIGRELLGLLATDPGKTLLVSAVSGFFGWMGSTIKGWWQSRDRYQAHETWQMTETIRGPEQFPVIVIQNVHTMPINVTRLRIRNGLFQKTGAWPFDSEDPDYPELPLRIGPYESGRLWLNEHAPAQAAEQCPMLQNLWVPRVYVGVETMGRGERRFVAEGGLKYGDRRERYRR